MKVNLLRSILGLITPPAKMEGSPPKMYCSIKQHYLECGHTYELEMKHKISSQHHPTRTGLVLGPAASRPTSSKSLFRRIFHFKKKCLAVEIGARYQEMSSKCPVCTYEEEQLNAPPRHPDIAQRDTYERRAREAYCCTKCTRLGRPASPNGRQFFGGLCCRYGIYEWEDIQKQKRHRLSNISWQCLEPMHGHTNNLPERSMRYLSSQNTDEHRARQNSRNDEHLPLHRANAERDGAQVFGDSARELYLNVASPQDLSGTEDHSAQIGPRDSMILDQELVRDFGTLPGFSTNELDLLASSPTQPCHHQGLPRQQNHTTGSDSRPLSHTDLPTRIQREGIGGDVDFIPRVPTRNKNRQKPALPPVTGANLHYPEELGLDMEGRDASLHTEHAQYPTLAPLDALPERKARELKIPRKPVGSGQTLKNLASRKGVAVPTDNQVISPKQDHNTPRRSKSILLAPPAAPRKAQTQVRERAVQTSMTEHPRPIQEQGEILQRRSRHRPNIPPPPPRQPQRLRRRDHQAWYNHRDELVEFGSLFQQEAPRGKRGQTFAQTVEPAAPSTVQHTPRQGPSQSQVRNLRNIKSLSLSISTAATSPSPPRPITMSDPRLRHHRKRQEQEEDEQEISPVSPIHSSRTQVLLSSPEPRRVETAGNRRLADRLDAKVDDTLNYWQLRDKEVNPTHYEL